MATAQLAKLGTGERVVREVVTRFERMTDRRDAITCGLTFPCSSTGRRCEAEEYYLHITLLSIIPTLYEKIYHEIVHHCDAIERRLRDGRDIMLDEFQLKLPPADQSQIESDVLGRSYASNPVSRLYFALVRRAIVSFDVVNRPRSASASELAGASAFFAALLGGVVAWIVITHWIASLGPIG